MSDVREALEKAQSIEAGKRARDITHKILDLLLKETADIEGDTRWLVMSRGLNWAYQHHFTLAIQTVNKQIKERETHTNPPPSEL